MSTARTNLPEIDESYYSRQLYVLGKEAMLRLADAHVFISGMRGLGVEIAKNIILGGAKSVIVHDAGKVDVADLSSQYYFAESNIGQSRAETALKKLAKLNSYVAVTCSSEDVTEAFLAKNEVHVIVLTDANLDVQIRVGDYCHQNGIKFINANTKGLFGQIFCDFGDEFQVLDTNGENPITQIVTEISHDVIGVVFIETDSRHGFEDGTMVTFQDVKGMTEVNGQMFKISVTSSITITIGDTSKFGVYEGGGTITTVKIPETIKFKSFSDTLANPEMLMCDSSKSSMPSNLHLAFQALSLFEKQYNALPKPWDEADAEKFYELVEKLNSQNREKPLTDELNKHWIKLFSKTCQGDLCPMQAIIGGITAQEVMKAVTGKFMPIRQFFYFDAIECLPENVCHSSNNISLPTTKARYYSQEIVFGADFQEKICKSKYFMVGGSATGCEVLKNFAMMGVGCEKAGAVFLSDRNAVKKSDLHRQCLFRPGDIGKSKSTVVAEALKTINADMNVCADIEGVASETEHIYDDNFYAQLDGVISTSRNRKTRDYIDVRCLHTRIPLIETNTRGTKGIVQVIISHLTESYSEINDLQNEITCVSIHKMLPVVINQTIEWASTNFNKLFTVAVEQAEEFLNTPKEFVQRLSSNSFQYHRIDIIENVKHILDSERPRNFVDCIKWARNRFQQQFHNNIVQILYHYPSDRLVGDGQRFWSGIKRCPHALNFDANNSIHLDFIVAASNLRAYVYYIPQTNDRQYIAEEVAKIEVSEFHPEAADVCPEVDHAFDHLPNHEDVRDVRIRAHQFDKDDESNFHIDYIAASANLRAENHQIRPAERTEIKLIAGSILPTIVTTSAMIAGLICLEVYKLLQGHQSIRLYRNTFVKLAVPSFAFSEPKPPKQEKYLDKEFTLWDRFEIDKDMTLEEFIEYFKKEHRLVPTMLASGLSLLYASHLLRGPSQANDMKRKISELYEVATKTKISDHVRSLILDFMCDDLEGNDIEDIPPVKYIFR